MSETLIIEITFGILLSIKNKQLDNVIIIDITRIM
jgi:hypothetical protein